MKWKKFTLTTTTEAVDYLGSLFEDLGIEGMEIEDHVPLTEQTRGMIGEREIGRMKPSAILINTARGPVVDSLALAAALKEGRLAGAAVDVYEAEPPIPQDHPLLTAPNVVATPHVAFATKEALYQRAVIVFDNVVGYLDGRPQNVM